MLMEGIGIPPFKVLYGHSPDAEFNMSSEEITTHTHAPSFFVATFKYKINAEGK